MTTERFSLKDHLFNPDKIHYLGGLLHESLDGFDRERFEYSVISRMPELELKERVAFIAEVLTDHLDPDFETAANQIREALPPPLDPSLTDDDFGDFIFAPFGKFVEHRGLAHYDTSMGLLKDLTMRFSMEGPVRSFINQQPEETLGIFEDWARDENYHVRRLVSESTRPTLPWAPRIQLDIRAPLPLLDILHADTTRYVTRSVANHLNDISKIDPSLVFDSLRRWHREAAQKQGELNWITTHSLRTLVKRGDPDAMSLLGYPPDPDVQVGPIEVETPIVTAGESLVFSVEIASPEEQRLMVDYVVDFVKRNGQRSPKVFKLKRFQIGAGDSVTLTKRHRLRADATTYKLYAGTHRLSVMVNGKPKAASEFEVRHRPR